MIILTDIHGNYETMLALLDKIPEEEKAKGIAICGDLIDRGPKSAQVVQYCIDNNIHVVRGNHEEMMVREGLEEASYFVKHDTFNYYGFGGSNIWLPNGGAEALQSYVKPVQNDSDSTDTFFDMDSFVEHVQWMSGLPYYIEFKDVKNDKGKHLLITHTSASKVWGWSKEHRMQNLGLFKNHLIWSRYDNINDIEGIFNIFGHTPIGNGPRIKEHYANIDTGCFYNKEPGYNTLTAIQFPEMIVYQQENIDRDRGRRESQFGEVEDD